MKNLSTKILMLLLLTAFAITETKAVSIPKNMLSNTTILPKKDSTTLNDSAYIKAINEFKSLSKSEKKVRAKEAKKLLKDYKKQKKNGDDVSTNELLLAILCVILPPLAVYLHQNKETNTKFWISLILTLLFWVPGIIYAILVVFFDL
jgi:uncharacterized membrane protein YqaE (UPF0057 family)